MRRYNNRMQLHRLLSVFVAVCMLVTLTVTITGPVPAKAAGVRASDAAIDLYNYAAGAELASGVYYLSQSKTFGSSGTMNNGLKIKSGAMVYLYVPEGVTLTAIGGGTNAARRQGGYAGILLPSNSTLILLGEGTVVATGGRAGNGSNGSSGSSGVHNKGNYYYSGSGGDGGAGGGGAGAGIGTNGGSGGSGGSANGNGSWEYDGDDNYNGVSGYSGGAGSTASACGTLYVQDTVQLTATGGTSGSRGSGGSAGSCAYSSSEWDGKKYHTAGGGGGGGGGGAGYYAYGIGSGGAGGGGGGSGGRGGIDYTENNSHDGPTANASCNAAGGSGGYGASNGSNGSGTRDSGGYDGSWSKVGGSGGGSGSSGSGSSQKTKLTSGWAEKSFTVTFKNANAGNIEQTSYSFGAETSTIILPDYTADVEDGYRFAGWKVSTGGVSVLGQNVPMTESDDTLYQPGDSIDVAEWFTGSIVFEPVIPEIKCKLYFDPNGGLGGPETALLKSDLTIQQSVAVPVRTGYDFLGYYTGMLNGTQYYDKNGSKVYTEIVPEEKREVRLYAQWKIRSSTVTIDPNGGTSDNAEPFTGNYGESVVIQDPVYNGEDKTFLRWALFETESETASENGSILRGAGYTTFVFGPEDTAVTLKAIWSAPNEAVLEVNNNVTQEVTSENLARVFRHEAAEANKGVTAEEAVAENKKVVLSVEKIAEDTAEASQAEDVANVESLLVNSSNESLSYFDISVTKIIDEVETRLVELPETVKINIPLTDELANRSGYSVYRVHEGMAERMSSSRSSEEYYVVNGDSITIYTKKFSTYAITASNSVIGEYPEAELNETNNFAATDVQGMYVDSSSEKVYKVDVEWGAMKFVFNKHLKWNPQEHAYDPEIRIALDDSAYISSNNQIVVSNHSNADVRISMTIAENNLTGVEMYVKQENNLTSDDAVDMALGKVADASGDCPAESVEAYVRLNGTLSEESLNALTTEETRGVFQKIGRLVVMIEPIADSETTPVYNGSGT